MGVAQQAHSCSALLGDTCSRAKQRCMRYCEAVLLKQNVCRELLRFADLFSLERVAHCMCDNHAMWSGNSRKPQMDTKLERFELARSAASEGRTKVTQAGYGGARGRITVFVRELRFVRPTPTSIQCRNTPAN